MDGKSTVEYFVDIELKLPEDDEVDEFAQKDGIFL
jgi:hypothetical protein